MNLSDLLGAGAGGQRPEHEHFWHMSEIVLGKDAIIDPTTMTQDQMDAAFAKFMTDLGVDRDSVVYMATQRGFRVLGLTTALDLLRPGMLQRSSELAGVYIDGFTTGVLYERKYG